MDAWRALARYAKAAFLWRWNLLAVGTAAVFAVLSRQPDVVLPLAAAAELTYLGLLSGHPRFRKAVDARTVRRQDQVDQAEVLARIKGALKAEAWSRFENLRGRCLSLDAMGRQFRGPEAVDNGAVTELQTGSLERLLWMFLKLLYSQDALQRFLRSTNRNQLAQQLSDAEKELQRATEQQRNEQFIASLRDKAETLRQRLANYDRAQENQEFLSVELDRIEHLTTTCWSAGVRQG